MTMATDMLSIEELHQRRRKATLIHLLSFCLWYVPFLFLAFWEPLQSSTTIALSLVIIALILFVEVPAILLLNRVNSAIAANPLAKDALNDERIREVRLRSFRLGFFVLAAYLALLILISVFHALPIRFAAGLGLFIGVVTQATSFLLYDRGDA